jgi:hypothetical protein
MTFRFQSSLLTSVALVLLSACATTVPVPVKKPPVEEVQAPITGIVEKGVFDLQYEIQRVPSERSLEEVIELSRQMSGYQQELALAILRSLESIPSGELTTMIESHTYDPEFTEWLELALQTRGVLIGQSSMSTAAQRWANYHYGHAITQADFLDLIQSYRRLFPIPSQVAVLLPTEGGLAAAAGAIRDGIMSAYLENPGKSVLRFYSSGETIESTIAAYLQAREDGATQIVGPLRSESAGALASLDAPGVPILLLNEPDEYNPVQEATVNSLLLSQAEEAMAIAGKAISQGRKKAILIVPDSAWGMRIETAFATKFEQGEGSISASERFNPAVEDYNDMLTRLLKIDESRQRKLALQSRLGMSLNFEPSRRDDFDFIFMAASPQEGRELKPLLRFHDAGDVPVFAMGRIFSGRHALASDQDLNDIVFPVTTWQLHTDETGMPALESIRDGSFANLYALGRDAWQVLPWLPLMQKDADLWFPGATGDLRMETDGHLQRQPAWAQFSNGHPVPYEWSGEY